MWRCAENLFGQTEFDKLEHLPVHQLRDCLEQVHTYLIKNPSLLKQGSMVHIARDAGPESVNEWIAVEAKRDYNGEGGGRFFKWYSRNVFERCVQEAMPADSSMPVHRDSLCERQVMEALVKTSLRLGKHPALWQKLRPWKGPQCVAHIACLNDPPCQKPSLWLRDSDSFANAIM